MAVRTTNGAVTGGLGDAAKEVAEHARSLVRLEVELAKLELQGKLSALGLGIGALVAAAVLAVFGVAFLLATIAAALSLVMPLWLALLVTGLLILVVAGGLALLGGRLLQQATPPVPEQAIDEAKLTTQVIKSDVHR